MKILLSGSTGLIGEALIPALGAGGAEVVRLARRPSADPHVLWDPAAGRIAAAALEGFDAVVHLAGRNIAAGRWTDARKEEIHRSRVAGTTLLAETLSRLAAPPRVLVCASAVGYYGDREDEVLTEESAPGRGFLPEVCQDWEAACRPAVDQGIRTVHLRFGMVLSARGGALAKMLPPFRFGLGGRIGSGDQYMSWVSLPDAVGIVRRALAVDALTGPVNAVAPEPVTNREFTEILGEVLHRPTVFPLPAGVARLALGEMADALLLASLRVEPRRLLASGHRFRHPALEGALRELLSPVARG